MTQPPVDAALLRACLANDRRAQRVLYDRTLPSLGFVVRRYLRDPAERSDALQETYLRVFRHLADYDAGRGGFLTWAGRIAINCCLARNAAAERRPTEAFRPAVHDRPAPPTVVRELTDSALLAWLQTMPGELYLVFSLYAVDGYSHGEIAEQLGITRAASRQRLRRARTWLQAELKRTHTPLTDAWLNLRGLQPASLAVLLHLFLHTLR